MANIELSPPDINFTISTKAVASPGSSSGLATPLNYSSISALDTALAAVSGSYYTTARLDQMGVNDKVYALRMHQDATTVANYLSNTTP
jgi:hypothetical protein